MTAPKTARTVETLRHRTVSQRGYFFILPRVICSKGSVGRLSNQFTPCPSRPAWGRERIRPAMFLAVW